NRPTAEPPPPPPGEPSHGSSVTDENAISEEDLFRLFVEPNADYFVKMRRAKADKMKFIWSFNWAVLLAFLPWFYYRKLYFIGTGIMLLPVIILLVFPDMSSIPGMTAMTLFLPMFVNLLYVEIAIRRVAKIVALGLSPEQRDERLRRAGGVSRLGATIGILIFLSRMVWQYLPPTLKSSRRIYPRVRARKCVTSPARWCSTPCQVRASITAMS
ncbi:MAG: hypothetical protein VCC99_14290, partial [Alphaproteobacteria bacterium]